MVCRCEYLVKWDITAEKQIVFLKNTNKNLKFVDMRL